VAAATSTHEDTVEIRRGPLERLVRPHDLRRRLQSSSANEASEMAQERWPARDERPTLKDVNATTTRAWLCGCAWRRVREAAKTNRAPLHAKQVSRALSESASAGAKTKRHARTRSALHKKAFVRP